MDILKPDGEKMGLHGKITDITGKEVMIKIRSKENAGKMVNAPMSQLIKRFK